MGMTTFENPYVISFQQVATIHPSGLAQVLLGHLACAEVS